MLLFLDWIVMSGVDSLGCDIIMLGLAQTGWEGLVDSVGSEASMSLDYLSPSDEKKSACTADSQRLILRSSADITSEFILPPPNFIVWMGSSRLSGSKEVIRPPSLLPPLECERLWADPDFSSLIDRLILRPLLRTLFALLADCWLTLLYQLADFITKFFFPFIDALRDPLSLDILTQLPEPLRLLKLLLGLALLG